MTKQQIEAYIDTKTNLLFGRATGVTSDRNAYKYGMALAMLESVLQGQCNNDPDPLGAQRREAKRMGLL